MAWAPTMAPRPSPSAMYAKSFRRCGITTERQTGNVPENARKEDARKFRPLDSGRGFSKKKGQKGSHLTLKFTNNRKL